MEEILKKVIWEQESSLREELTYNMMQRTAVKEMTHGAHFLFESKQCTQILGRTVAGDAGIIVDVKLL